MNKKHNKKCRTILHPKYDNGAKTWPFRISLEVVTLQYFIVLRLPAVVKQYFPKLISLQQHINFSSEIFEII